MAVPKTGSALERLKHSEAFLVSVWRAIRPHMPAIEAGEPSRNGRVQVFDALTVASRAFGARRLRGAQGHDSRLLHEIWKPVFRNQQC